MFTCNFWFCMRICVREDMAVRTLEEWRRLLDKHDCFHFIACYLLAERGLDFPLSGMTHKPNVQQGCLRRSVVLAWCMDWLPCLNWYIPTILEWLICFRDRSMKRYLIFFLLICWWACWFKAILVVWFCFIIEIFFLRVHLVRKKIICN